MKKSELLVLIQALELRVNDLRNRLAELRDQCGLTPGKDIAQLQMIVLEIGPTWLVVGVAPGQVRTLHSMPKADLSASPAETPPNMDGKFQGWLKQMMEKRNVR